MSISNETAKFWADESAEFLRGLNKLAETHDRLPQVDVVEEDAEDARDKALFDKIEALETAWAELGYKIDSWVGGMGQVHRLLGGAIEALKELAYASKPPE